MTISTSPAAALARHWPWLAGGVSLSMLAIAHAFERFGGLYPCPLCLRQREVYWAAIALSGVGLAALRLWPRAGLKRSLAAFLGIAFLTGTLVAGYHVAVEEGFVVARCEGFSVPADLTLGRSTQPLSVARCDAPAWSLLGVSMAGYNMAVSFVLALTSLAVAAATPVHTDPSLRQA
jgi:disulfide bond formation protein DsbB